MPWRLIKNNLKLILRKKWLLVMLILGPLIIIELVSSAFSKFMASYEDCGPIDVGYRVVTEGAWNQVLESDAIKSADGFKFTQYGSDEIKDLIDNGYCDVFVEFNGMNYTMYESDDHKTEALSTEYLLNEVSQSMVFGSVSDGKDVEVTNRSFESAPDISSNDYYGFIYIIFFAGCAIVTASPIYNSESKNRITKRYGITGTGRTGLFLGKFIPCVVTQLGLTLITSILCTAIFGLEWGNVPVIAGILALTIITFTQVEMFLCYIIPNTSVSTGLSLASLWFMGFIGGSFEAYTYSQTAQWLKDIDPLYYVNRAVVENASVGSSSYTGRCVVLLLVISTVFLAANLIVSSGKEGKLK